MEKVVTLEVIKGETGDTIKYPEGTIITADAKSWAKNNFKTVYVGGECVVNPEEGRKDEDHVVISVVGRDKIGIIASVARMLADCNVNILDINQTLINGLFTMIMVVDVSLCSKDFNQLKKDLSQLGEKIGVKIDAQKQAIFNYMQRI
ncbi:ACT domain-containing protein [Caldanaerobius polysaccharolyticus]|nr:ACT domain-containing protein [Caldanaerobius polysaccharolyticus]